MPDNAQLRMFSTLGGKREANPLGFEIMTPLEAASKEAKREDEREAEEEETSTDEERAESADDEAENFGKY